MMKNIKTTITSSRAGQHTTFLKSVICLLAGIFVLFGVNRMPTATMTTAKDTASGGAANLRTITTDANANAGKYTVRSDSCSCYNSTATSDCCQRMIRHFHKMGYVLTFEVFRTNESRLEFSDNGRRYAPKRDYRDVLFIRNLYEAIVSGYLYHKTGHECWLGVGNKVANSSQHYLIQNYVHWEPLLKASKHKKMRIQQLDPPNNKSSLCGYLNQVSEEYGMQVFIVFYFAYYFDKVLDNYRYAHTLEDHNRSLFLCYEDLADAATKEATRQRTLGFLYPGDNHRRERWQRRHKLSEGHGTDHNPELRTRLRELIKQYDAEYFNQIVAKAQSLFKCGEEN